MRLWVRPGVKIILSLNFSWFVGSAPDTPKEGCSAGRRTLSPDNPIPGCVGRQKEKRTLPRTPADVVEFSGVAAINCYPHPGPGILTRFPFAGRPRSEEMGRV